MQDPDTGQGMNEAGEYERRISGALVRIAQALERQRKLASVPDAVPPEAPIPPDSGETDDPTALSELRQENERLTDELQALRRANERLTRDHASMRARLVAMDEALQSLRAAQAESGRIVTELRRALAEQVAEPELVNRAMQAEIEALAAQREADVAEVDAVLDTLASLVTAEDDNAAG